MIHPYQQAVLEHGVCPKDQEEEGSSDLRMGMEFAGAIGTMLMDKITETNEWISNHVEVVMDWAQEGLELLEDLDRRLAAEKERGDLLKEHVHHLELEREGL